MKRTWPCILSALLAVGRLPAQAEPLPGWKPVFEDNFDREHHGRDWVNHITVDGAMTLRDQKLAFFRTANFYCRQPLPQGEVRVE
jgi:hypothetical protein